MSGSSAKFGCLAVLAALLCACEPASSDLPITGEIKLEFSPRSESGLYFQLKNQSSRAIAVRGGRIKSKLVNPWVAWVECAEVGSELWTEGPFALVDGGEASVVVESGKGLDLVLGFDHHRVFAQDYERCKLNVKLENGTVVTSGEFQTEQPLVSEPQ